MSKKFMKIKKMVIPILSLAILMGSIVGCSVMKSDELLDMLNKDSTITIELAEPNYEAVKKGVEKAFEWKALDQLETYNKGFRQSIDEVFNINIVTESGKNGKNGVLFIGEEGKRNGNATLADAFRNKVFIEKYWKDAKVKDALAKSAGEAYIDLSEEETERILAAFNAYYNLFVDGTEGSSYFFNGSESLTREGFMSGVYRAENGVQELTEKGSFNESVGGPTDHSKFAKEVEGYSFLQTENKSLDATTYSGNISRAEAVYMLVKMHFNEDYEKVTGKEKAFSDTKNAGDIALKLGFKEKNKETKAIEEKGRWESYTLAYMMKNPDKGMQEELYKAMVVAKDKGLITSNESRWDEPLSKSEALLLLVNTQTAKNKAEGYASDKEYGEMVVSEVVDPVDENSIVDEEGIAQVQPDDKVPLGYGMTYKELRDEVDSYYKTMKKNKVSQEDAMAELEAFVKGYGATIEELNSLPGYSVAVGEKAPVAVKPTTPTNPTTPTKPTTPTNPSGGGGTENPVTDWDKNGNGINDDLEGVTVTGDVTSDSWEPGRENPFEMP